MAASSDVARGSPASPTLRRDAIDSAGSAPRAYGSTLEATLTLSAVISALFEWPPTDQSIEAWAAIVTVVVFVLGAMRWDGRIIRSG